MMQCIIHTYFQFLAVLSLYDCAKFCRVSKKHWKFMCLKCSPFNVYSLRLTLKKNYNDCARESTFRKCILSYSGAFLSLHGWLGSFLYCHRPPIQRWRWAGVTELTRNTHIVYSVQCLVCSLQCTVSSVQYLVSSAQCIVSSLQCLVCSLQCAVCSVQCVQCAVCSEQCSVFSVQCAECSEQ